MKPQKKTYLVFSHFNVLKFADQIESDDSFNDFVDKNEDHIEPSDRIFVSVADNWREKQKARKASKDAAQAILDDCDF